ncbi:hypothetical protein [Nocardia yamanashiensis]|uniref:hypothetical protein n=1 Tax=Nocardia yamanashiensis TaxID=209247 RepID=UPI000AD6BE98|nr:hypothetical protein [Nocardia yamanashiensis]
MIEQDDGLAARPPLPALDPIAGESDSPAAAPGWAQWLNEGAAPVESAADRESRLSATELLAEDPMAPLVLEARRRAAQTQRRRQLRDRFLLAGGALLTLVVLGVAVWLTFTPEADEPVAAPPPSPQTSATDAQPGLNVWCPAVNTPDRVIGSGAGDPGTGPGAIMRLEYAWYVQRDPAAVRALLAPGAQAASEEATRTAISATPAGTQHCVTITPLGSDRWNVNVDELRPDGSRPSWQQIMITTVSGGQARISAILAGGN